MLEILVFMVSSFVVIILFLILGWYNDRVNKRIEYKRKIREIDYYINRINEAETLLEMYFIHINMWRMGLRHENFSPFRYGIFRTEDISKMSPSDVYLGNSYTGCLKNIPEWLTESYEDQLYALEQYRRVLGTSLFEMRKEIFNKI